MSKTYFEVVCGHYGGSYPQVYAHKTREGALARAENCRKNITASRGLWVPMKSYGNDDGYEQVGWELNRDNYVYVSEKVMRE